MIDFGRKAMSDKDKRISDLQERICTKQSRITALESAITKTLNENAHLADGDDCTLIDLKLAMPEWEKSHE